MNHTTVSPADRLRSALQQAGFTARQVTVRAQHSTLRVTIRSASVSLTRVTEIAGAFEVVRRDHATQEILCGGNTYVDVQYAAALVAPIQAAVMAALEAAPEATSVALPGGYRAIKRGRGATYAQEVRIWGPGFNDYNNLAVGFAFAAKRIAIARLDASASGTESVA